MLKRGVILVNQYVVLLRDVVPENFRMRHCVDKTTRWFDIITYCLDKLLLNKMTQTLHNDIHFWHNKTPFRQVNAICWQNNMPV